MWDQFWEVQGHLVKQRFYMNTDPHVTHPSLLVRLRDLHNVEAWEQFVEIYTPLVYSFCFQHGLQDADAADISQEVMRAVAQAISRFEYDPQRGRFRAWLLAITRNKLKRFMAKKWRQPQGGADTAVMQQWEAQSVLEEDREWDQAYQSRLFQVASERVRSEVQESTWRAFWLTTFEEQDGRSVAQNLGMSVGAVYIAKSRVLARLTKCIQTIDGESGEKSEQ